MAQSAPGILVDGNVVVNANINIGSGPEPEDGDVGDEVDLERVVRDAVLLSLPLAPLCREDCPGPAPESFPARVAADPLDDEGAEPSPDPRWAGLDQLKFD